MTKYIFLLPFILGYAFTSLDAQTQIGNTFEGDSTTLFLGSEISLSSDGNRIAYTGYDVINDRGFIKVSDWGAGIWNQLGNDIPAVISFNGGGVSLSANGNRVAGFWDDEFVIYDWNGVNWNQLGDGIDEAFGFFDISLSGNGSRVAIGGDSCRMHIYEWNGVEWNQLGNSIEDAISSPLTWLLGKKRFALSWDGNTLATSKPAGGCTISTAHEEVKIFKWDGGSWNQQGSSIIAGPGDDDDTWNNFGFCVALSSNGERVAFSLPNDENNKLGKVFIFEWNGNSWVQVGLSINEVEDEDGYAHTISLSSDGNRVAISNLYNQGLPWGAGQVDIYNWNGSDWEQFGNSVYGMEEEDFLGVSLSLSSDGNRFAATSYGFHGDDFFFGKIQVFENGITPIEDVKKEDMIIVYPNPTREKFSINGIEVQEIRIFDSFGRIVKEQLIFNQAIDISELPNGLYFISAKIEKGVITKRIIKE